MEILLGSDNIGDTNLTVNYHHIVRTICIESGFIGYLYFYSLSSGNGKINIYNGNVSVPDNLLWANNNSQAFLGSQWNGFAVYPLAPVIKANYYWVGICADTSGVASRYSATGGRRYKGYTYSSYSAYNPIESGYSSSSGSLISCYGLGNLLYSNPLLLCTI